MEPKIETDPVQVALRRWKWCVGASAIGMLVGATLAIAQPTEFTAEARLAVGSDSLNAFQVAGYSAGVQSLAANYARYVNSSSPFQDALTEALGSPENTVVEVRASPIPESNVVRVEAVATDGEDAVSAAQVVADQLVTLSRSSDSNQRAQSLLKRYQTLNERLEVQRDALETDSDVSATDRARLATLRMQATSLEAAYQEALRRGVEAREGQLRSVQSASLKGDDAAEKIQLFVLAGGAVGLGVGVTGANLAQRKRRREVAPSVDSVYRRSRA